MPLLKNPKLEVEERALYWHFPHYYTTTSPVSAIRHGDWKLLEFHEDSQVELYHLESDLSEQNNLATENPNKVKTMLKQLQKWRQGVNAPMATPNPNFGKR